MACPQLAARHGHYTIIPTITTTMADRPTLLLNAVLSRPRLHLSLPAQDIRVTRIEHSHGGTPEQLTASRSKLDLWKKKGYTVSQFALQDPLLPGIPSLSNIRSPKSLQSKSNFFSEQRSCLPGRCTRHLGVL